MSQPFNAPRVVKKEFVTYWTPLKVAPHEKLTIDQSALFHMETDGRIVKTLAIMPDKISYNDMMAFAGKKTKVTIEIIHD